MKNILITGGAGFIGSNLAFKLFQQGYIVTLLYCLSPQIHGDNPEYNSPLSCLIKEKVKFIKGNVCERAMFEKAIVGQDAIVHLAPETGTSQLMYEIQKYTDINMGPTALMLDILTNTKHIVKKVVIAASRAIYGEGLSKSRDGIRLSIVLH